MGRGKGFLVGLLLRQKQSKRDLRVKVTKEKGKSFRLIFKVRRHGGHVARKRRRQGPIPGPWSHMGYIMVNLLQDCLSKTFLIEIVTPNKTSLSGSDSEQV